MTKFRKLNRPTGHSSMLRTMVSQLVKHERIETTVAKAKEIRRLAVNMVQLGKKIMSEHTFISQHFCVVKPSINPCIHLNPAFSYCKLPAKWPEIILHHFLSSSLHVDDGEKRDRAGGYTRLLRTRIRVGDAAPMAYIEFIDRENELRESKSPTPQPPQKAPLDPWTKSWLSRQFASPKEDKKL